MGVHFIFSVVEECVVPYLNRPFFRDILRANTRQRISVIANSRILNLTILEGFIKFQVVIRF